MLPHIWSSRRKVLLAGSNGQRYFVQTSLPRILSLWQLNETTLLVGAFFQLWRSFCFVVTLKLYPQKDVIHKGMKCRNYHIILSIPFLGFFIPTKFMFSILFGANIFRAFYMTYMHAILIHSWFHIPKRKPTFLVCTIFWIFSLLTRGK